MLAGLPQAPTEWNPILHPDAAKVRQLEVLTAMERAGFVTHEESATAYSENLAYNPLPASEIVTLTVTSRKLSKSWSLWRKKTSWCVLVPAELGPVRTSSSEPPA